MTHSLKLGPAETSGYFPRSWWPGTLAVVKARDMSEWLLNMQPMDSRVQSTPTQDSKI